METKFNILALTKPLTYIARINVDQGSLSQIYDNLNGGYTPDRSVEETVLSMSVEGVNPNTKQNVSPALTSARWYLLLPATADAKAVYDNVSIKQGGLVEEEITSATDGFTISGTKLKISRNIAYGMSGGIVRCVAVFTDPVSGNALTAEDSVTLTTTLNTAANLSLNIASDKDVTDMPYAGSTFMINALKVPPTGTNWRVRCRVQLKDGTVDLDPAYTNDGASSKRTGSAFYFWYLKNRDGSLTRLTESNEWFTCQSYPDGTQAQECIVDLSKANDVRLVAKAGFVPYGEYPDYLNADGLILPSKCKFGHLQKSFSLRVALPMLERIEVASIAHDKVNMEDFSDQQTTIGRKVLVTAGGTCVNLVRDSEGNSVLTKLFNIVWNKDNGDGTETVLGNDEDLNVTLATLGATDKDHLPEMSVSVEPTYPDLFGNNYVVGYNAASDDVVPIEKHGNSEFLKQLEFMLFDTTTEDDSGTFEAHTLQRNNLLRYKSGNYAPTVGIKEEQRAECDNALYTDAAGKTLAYAAGKYNAVTEWEQHDKALMAAGGKPRTLYKKAADGTISEVSHKLRPWETTDTKDSIGLGYEFPVYVLDQVRGKSGKVWKGIFTDVTEWDGIDLTPYKLNPTALGPGAFCTVGDKARNFFYLYQGENNCQGEVGNGGAISCFHEQRTYPRSSDVQQITSMTYCRSNNKDTNAPYPMAEGGYFALDTLVTAVELMAGTKYLQGADKYGSGISSNDGPSASNFYKVGGVRFKMAADSGYTYNTWGTSHTITIGGNATNTSWSQLASYERAKEQCMESQMALSMAVELGIKPTTSTSDIHYFYFYGSKYYYMTVPGTTTPAEGQMNARLYKVIDTSYTDDKEGKVDLEFILRMSLYSGAMLSGDVFVYCGGGAELVAKAIRTRDENQYGNPVGFWIETDQKKWKHTTAVTISENEKFDFEGSYKNLIPLDGNTVTVNNNWLKNRVPYTPFAKDNSSASRGDCMYIWDDNWYNTDGGNKKTRLALRFGFYATFGYCAPRSLYCHSACNTAARYYAVRAQALVRITQ